MNPRRLIPALTLAALLMCGEPWVCAQPVSITAGKALPRPLEGMSAEYDPHFLTQNVGATPGILPAHWESVILRRLKLLRLQRLRVMVLPYWYEPVNDNSDPFTANPAGFNFRTPEFQALERLLQFCQTQDIRVTLVFWGAYPGTFLLPEQEPGWVLGPSQYDEWSENISRCLTYMLKERRYSCIEAVTPVNEPDWSWIPSAEPNIARYIKMCRNLDLRLRADGLRKLVRLNLSDNSDGGSGTHAFLDSCARRLTREADILNSHTYIFGYNTPDSTIISWERENIRLSHPKPHLIGEFGSNQTEGSTRQRDINLYERGILMARIAINCLNAGAGGLSYWSLFDQYYSRREAAAKQYPQMQQLGLWKYIKSAYAADTAYTSIQSDYEPRPQYYAIGLLTRFIRRGHRVIAHTSDTGGAHPVLILKSPKGRYTYIIANPGSQPAEYIVTNPRAPRRLPFSVYRYTRHTLPADDSMLTPTGETPTATGHTLRCSLAPNTLAVFTQEEP